MILNKTRLRHPKDFQSLIRIEKGPPKFQKIKELLQVLLQNNMDTWFIFIAEAEHHLVGIRLCAPNDVTKDFYVKVRFDFQFEDAFVKYYNLVAWQDNYSVNILFAESVNLHDWLEIHYGMFRINELL